MMKLTFLFFYSLAFWGHQLLSQEDSLHSNPNLLKVYLDCNYCDNAFVMQNVHNISFVRDSKQADVHVLYVSQSTGGGGTAEKIQFIGQGLYKRLSDIISYTTSVDMSENDKRELRLKYLEYGLLRYRIENGQEASIFLTIEPQEDGVDTQPEDPWNSWVFSMNGNGWFSGQETSKTINLSSGGSAKRITEDKKFMLSGGFNQDRTIYNYDGVKTEAKKRSSWGNVQEVISLNDHWSYGFFGNIGNSLYSNYRFYGVGKAGIECDIFKYSESFNKQAIIAYNIGARYNNYYDTTVFNRINDRLAFQEVTIGGTVKEDWGNFASTISYQNFLNDFSLNSVSLWLNLKVRLFKGFSWRINGSFDIRQNQINIARQDASIEDVLLQQQELGTNYSYWINTGINYSFGSVYNAAVNPRFDI